MRLDELSDINMGQSPNGESLNETEGMEFHQGKVFFGDLSLGQSSVKTSAPTKLAKPGDVLICVRAPVGVVNLTDREVCIGRGLAALTPKQGVPGRLLLHLLRHHQYTIEQIATGSTFASITTEQLRTIDFPVPNKAMWLRIAGILGSLDEKIELNRRKIAELEALAKTIYDYWFVQFDFPDANGRPYKSSGGAMEWKDELKRDIPRGWKVKPLGELANFANGVNYSSENQCGEKYRIVNVRDISASNIFIYENGLSELRLPKDFADRYLIAPESILIARSGIPGAIRLIANEKNTIYSGFVINCEPILHFSKEYLMYYLKKLEGSGATHKDSSILNNVSQDMLKRIQISIPDPTVLKHFHETISPIFGGIISAQQAIKETMCLRDSLLPLLMNGQVGVSG